MPTAPIAMAPASERPPIIVSAGYFSRRRAPSFQSSHETVVSRLRPEAAGISPDVIGHRPARTPQPAAHTTPAYAVILYPPSCSIVWFRLVRSPCVVLQ